MKNITISYKLFSIKSTGMLKSACKNAGAHLPPEFFSSFFSQVLLPHCGILQHLVPAMY